MILEEFHKNILMILEDGVTVFTDAIKTNVLAKKMAKKFTSPNPFKDTVGNMVNTSVLFLA
ncbi:6038_t:CDS:2 [Funneliformis geosporum]|uniref:6038_t:CDS:1 n=1 Tax=Funneliformis geosporum TaxID=1117311 RepID=A0A9W4WQD3_9GLOM|nr:6038_t:CDS:2 [Funneliformis geosporum]